MGSDAKTVPNGTYTIVDQNEYVTLRLREHWDKAKHDQRVAEYLSGPDNENDFTGFAFLLGRTVLAWRSAGNVAKQVEALKVLLHGDWRKAGEVYAMLSGNCFLCNRRLTVPISLHRGMGPICAGKIETGEAVAVAAKELASGIAGYARQTNVDLSLIDAEPMTVDEYVKIMDSTLLTPSMSDILGPSGVIAQSLPGYESRQPQIDMAELLAEAIAAEEHAIVEAGTGTGKSLGYLIPAIYSHKKTVVSTGDKALQMQLWNKDLPFLKSVLPVSFTAAILKGRSNYVCLEKYAEEIGAQTMLGESYEFGQLKAWLATTETGDIEELPISLSSELQAQVTSTSNDCLGQQCPQYRDCFAERAKSNADRADIVIVNHSLLTIDCSIRASSDDYAKAISDRELVILDEAHRLQDAATLAFTEEISAIGVMRLLHDRHAQAARLDPSMLAKVEDSAQGFFDSLARISNSQTFAVNEPPQAIRLQAENLSAQLRNVAHELKRNNPYTEGPKVEAYKKYVERVNEYGDTVFSMLVPSSEYVIYVEKRQGAKRQLVYLKRCPISVADALRESLFSKWPVICTSATIATGNSFDYFKSTVGCDSARELIVQSPFDYKRNMLVYRPMAGSMLDPSKYYQEGSEEYFNRLGEQIEQLLLASNGRAFCLFTSNRALNAIHERIAHRLKWLVLKQGDMPRPELLKRFKEDGNAVLFSLRSFWEGVDVKGEALSLVIVDKIPFGTPDDPVYQARCNEINRQRGNEWAWFNELAIPAAIITLKQGVGRLIRTKTDFGVVALMDERLSTKRYASTIFRSLPEGKTTQGIEVVKAFFDTRG